MNPFASQTSITLPMQGDGGQTITIRRLTGREIEKAQEAHALGIAAGGARTWAARFRRILERGPSDPEVVVLLADPLTGFDRYVLIHAGLTAWSYPQSLTKPVAILNGQPAPTLSASPDTWVDPVEDLDDDAADYIAREILRLTKPALFIAPEAVEDAQGEPADAAPATR